MIPLTSSPEIRPASVPAGQSPPASRGNAPNPIPDNQFRAASPCANGADPVILVDQPQLINNRAHQLTDAARLVMAGSHHALPFIFIPFPHASEIADGRQ